MLHILTFTFSPYVLRTSVNGILSSRRVTQLSIEQGSWRTARRRCNTGRESVSQQNFLGDAFIFLHVALLGAKPRSNTPHRIPSNCDSERAFRFSILLSVKKKVTQGPRNV